MASLLQLVLDHSLRPPSADAGTPAVFLCGHDMSRQETSMAAVLHMRLMDLYGIHREELGVGEHGMRKKCYFYLTAI